jgi:hypothetical protein
VFAVPSNLCATKAVDRLLQKGFPASQLLHVVGEQAAFNHAEAFVHPTVRVTDYEHNDGIQIIIGTVQVLPRIFLLKNVKKGLYQKSPLYVVVCFCCDTQIYMNQLSSTLAG